MCFGVASQNFLEEKKGIEIEEYIGIDKNYLNFRKIYIYMTSVNLAVDWRPLLYSVFFSS